MPVPDDGYYKKAETCSTYCLILSENACTYLLEGPPVCLLQKYRNRRKENTFWHMHFFVASTNPNLFG
jgi:hypothetical protein